MTKRIITKDNYPTQITEKDLAVLDNWFNVASNLSCILNTQEMAIATACENGECTDAERMDWIRSKSDLRHLILRIEQDVLAIKDAIARNIDLALVGLDPDDCVSDRCFSDITAMLDPMTEVTFGLPALED